MKKNTKSIKLFDPVIDSKEEQLLLNTLRSHFWASGAGTNSVSAFEEKFKKYVNAKECVAVNSGTAALNLALSLIDIKQKEVIVPSLTFVSTVNAIKLNHGIPVFCDVEPEPGCISIEKMKKKINKKTKAVIPVHFGGFPCDLKKINELCKRWLFNNSKAFKKLYNQDRRGKFNFLFPDAVVLEEKMKPINDFMLKLHKEVGLKSNFLSESEIHKLLNMKEEKYRKSLQ